MGKPRTVPVVVVPDVLDEGLHEVLQETELHQLEQIRRSLHPDERRCPDGTGIVARATKAGHREDEPEFEVDLVELPW